MKYIGRYQGRGLVSRFRENHEIVTVMLPDGSTTNGYAFRLRGSRRVAAVVAPDILEVYEYADDDE